MVLSRVVLCALFLGCSGPGKSPSPAPTGLSLHPSAPTSAGSTAIQASTAPTLATSAVEPPPKKPLLLGINPPSFASTIACEGELDRSKLLAALKAFPKGAPAAQIVVRTAVGSECTLPALVGVDAVLLVIDGGGTASAPDKSLIGSLHVWQALQLPGLGVRFSTRTTAITALVALASTDGTDLSAKVAKGTTWTERPGTISKTSVLDREQLAWDGGTFRAAILFEGPTSPHLSLEVLILGAGASIPSHEHAEWELLSVMSGSGSMSLAGVDLPVDAGKHVAIPAKTAHAFKAGDARVIVVQSYAPAGPEQRFKKLALTAPSMP